jgi:hypothetical protein
MYNLNITKYIRSMRKTTFDERNQRKYKWRYMQCPCVKEVSIFLRCQVLPTYLHIQPIPKQIPAS